jgi:hypothetical protein
MILTKHSLEDGITFSLFKFDAGCFIPLGFHLEMSGSLIMFLTEE